ncbi:Sec62 family protein translocation protein [Colletotrichum melonis]|uniref:Translocation protein SEC62 n=4 Tax=Colletotrichum acutatum species complex TaxID=2707335 RepID=A0AAI9Z551_9PEZI|nr:Sec62 family protein translocation protein [Colletotrichum costaricense]XP_060386647.1 Sec62 family protein translocation protein [Colletotrichum tamarilloi]KAI3549274.1 Sec62 family protein translocation protein [Colletotrichum filicis]KAK0368275.1 Sec62 family protein translocation protein [Colletotrichum limetticola]KAK1447647.1 Sec62 family protein translocation protein [Colletotrichum melonis]KAK1507694.1 Sec62 family protein translocation protein [Colletotrichum tamarilloi]KAK1533124
MSMPMPGPMGPMQMGPNGQPMPSPEQIAAMRRQIEADAQKAGMSVPDFLNHLRQQAMQQQQMAMRQQQQQQQQQQGGEGGEGGHDHAHDHDHDHEGHQHPHPHQHQQQQPQQGQPQPIRPGPPNPVALALASFLRAQDLKPRTCILNGERKDMFKVKRALRALQSPAYEKARKKNPELPEITDRASLENTFKLLPMSMLALRVTKTDPHEGHDHGPKKTKRIKGLWTVRIEPQQEAKEEMYYAWFWEGSQVKRKLYSILALVLIFIVVCYPLWPLKLRLGVYYLSWGFLGLLGLFFLMAIFRVILFCITYFVASPGLWLFPNLWEDVSFMDSFKPVWAWHDTAPKKGKKKKASSAGASSAGGTFAASTGQPLPASATTTATETQIASQPAQRPGYVAPAVEELGDDEE